jgi:hypothetical protein
LEGSYDKRPVNLLTSCIYYDLEDVSSDDVRRARAHAKGGHEFIAHGASWPIGIDGPQPSEVVSPRDFVYHEELMDWTSRLFAALEQSPAAPILSRPNGVSLLEIVRYKFLLEFAHVEQRWRALSEMARSGAERILWVAPRSRCRGLATLGGPNLPAELELCAAVKAPKERNPVYRFARSLARRMLDRLADHSARLMGRPLVPKSGKTAVFVEYFPNSAEVLLPVADALRRNHGVDVVWLATRRPVKQFLDRSGVSSVSLRRMSPIAHRRRERLGAAACSELRAALDGMSDELFCGTGSFKGKAYLLPAILERLLSSLNEATYWLDSLSEAIGHLGPQCVVSTTYSSIVGRAAALAGRSRDAHSVYVQHGIFPHRDYFTHFCNDMLLLWGDANRRTMVRNGIADSKIRVVGATIYDDLVQRIRPNRSGQFPKPGEPIRIAYFASRTGGLAVRYSTARQCLSTVAGAASQISNAHLTVKIHPGDKTGMAESVLRAFPDVAIVRQGKSQEVIRRCDVAIVVSSTTGLEACVADKPLIVLKVAGVPDYGPYPEYGAALQIDLNDPQSVQVLAEAIQSLADRPADLAALAEGRRRLVDDLLNGGTGNATELTAQAIADLVEHKNQPVWQLNAAN